MKLWKFFCKFLVKYERKNKGLLLLFFVVGLNSKIIYKVEQKPKKKIYNYIKKFLETKNVNHLQYIFRWNLYHI
jgi:hypothetical protein